MLSPMPITTSTTNNDAIKQPIITITTILIITLILTILVIILFIQQSYNGQIISGEYSTVMFLSFIHIVPITKEPTITPITTTSPTTTTTTTNPTNNPIVITTSTPSSTAFDNNNKTTFSPTHSPTPVESRPEFLNIDTTEQSWKWIYDSHHTGLLPVETSMDYSKCGPCCVGVVGLIERFNMCQNLKDIDLKFTVPGRSTLYSFVDTFISISNRTRIKKKHPLVVIFGDSHGGILYQAGSCELARTPGVKIIARRRINIPNIYPIRQWENVHGSFYNEYYTDFTIQLKELDDDSGKNTINATLLYIHVYRPFDLGIIHHVCTKIGADMMIFTFGAHYPHTASDLLVRDMTLVAKELQHCSPNITLIWWGHPAQHFFQPNHTATQDCGEFDSTMTVTSGAYCSNVQSNLGSGYKCSAPLNQRMNEFFTISNGVDSRMIDFSLSSIPVVNKNVTKINNTRNNNIARLYVMPTWNLTVPFFYQHPIPLYKGPLLSHFDCAHICLPPRLREPFWDGFFIAEKLKGIEDGFFFYNGLQSFPRPYVLLETTIENLMVGRNDENVDGSLKFKLFRNNDFQLVPFNENTSVLWNVRYGTGKYTSNSKG
jgi:hypothetical protein